MGGFGAYRRANLARTATRQTSFDYWITYITKTAIANGVNPFFGDTGIALDRRNKVIPGHRTINAIIAGSR